MQSSSWRCSRTEGAVCFHVVRVDGSGGIQEVAAAVEKIFAVPIGAGPRADNVDARLPLERVARILSEGSLVVASGHRASSG